MTLLDYPSDLTPVMSAFDYDRFASPRAIDRPVPFFSWNEKMEPDEIRRQVGLIADAGWGGVFVHSRVGLTTPYMGEEWFAAVDAALEECILRGLKLWLYDEDKWPSGFSGGSVPLADPAYRQHNLVARPAEAPTPADCEPLGEPQGGLQLYVWTAPLGHAWFNGTCYADLMSRDAMRKFLDDAYEPYHHRYSKHYGDTIIGEFTDEPCSIFRDRLPNASLPYTPQLLERFTQMHGYDPVPKLHLLYLQENGAAQFRLHYYRTINDLFENNFSRQLGDWCTEHGIALTGHYMCEDNLFAQQLWGVKIMPNYRHEGIPGIDHLVRQIGHPITAKQCQSVVNQYAKPRMLSELYGVDGGSLSFEDRAWIAAQQMCLGVNLLNPHLSLYTMAGCRKRDYPQNIYYQQPFWPLNNVLDDRLSRVCAALSQGRYVAEALVIHPQESVFCHWTGLMDPQRFEGLVKWDWECVTQEARDEIGNLDVHIKRLLEILLGGQRTFDFGDETILAEDADVHLLDGVPQLRIRHMNYPLVILPAMTTIAQTTVNLLTQFLDGGGVVIATGGTPGLLDGLASDEKLTCFLDRCMHVELEALGATLSRVHPPLVQVAGLDSEDREKLYLHLRNMDNGERIVYLTNLNRLRTFTGTFTFAGDYSSARLLDTSTGETSVVESDAEPNQVTVDISFAPAQTHLLLLSADRAEPELPLAQGDVIEEIDLTDSDWSVQRLDDNAITLDYAFWKQDEAEWSDTAVPVIAVQEYLNSVKWDGSLSLRYGVEVANLTAERKIHLVLEYPDRYRISVNGHPVEYTGLPAWRDIRWMPIDITGLLIQGANRVQLDCKFHHGDLTSIEDQFARYGTEIESIYLVGDFAVQTESISDKPVAEHWQEFGLPPISVQCFSPGKFVLADPAGLQRGDTTVQGLPFYAGRLEYSTVLPPLNPSTKWSLAIEKLDAAVAEVSVDCASAGYLVQHPLEVPLPVGTTTGSKLTLTLYGTLRNLLGPHHRPEGELACVGPGHFSAKMTLADREANRWVFDHAEGKDLAEWTDRYCMVSFGDCGRMQLVRRLK